MNPTLGRVRKHSEFLEVCRGPRTASPHLVFHYSLSSETGVNFGFSVPKAVGCAVERNKVKRRLRACCRDLAGSLPEGARVVLRARPSAAAAGFWDLHSEVEGAFLKIASEA
ncbi:MAG: ribonuclease P protein component [Aeriscardovia sp.]|nr:ribonuclease P protein component [Aeriscardovia sp.]